MHAEVVAYVRCPLCGDSLRQAATSLRCLRGHSFDQARQGYVHLAPGPLAHTGDTPAMVAARADFLGAGHFGAITEALSAATAATWPGDLVVDVGGGIGHHLAGVLECVPPAWGLCLDASKPAAKLAARRHPRMDAVVCDVWAALPLADRGVGVLLNVFAPRHAVDFARVLRPDGALHVVTPAADHLAELIGPLGLLRVDPEKQARLDAALDATFRAAETVHVRHPMRLHHREIAALVGMGPSARHRDAAEIAARIGELPATVTVTASVQLASYRHRG
jgi:23S rRNA (guanine745-N1)-methyltransferase